jgi:UDP-N-acetylbacillosamine N-acetyltransferase
LAFVTDRVVIWGASGHALVVADILRLEGREVAGFIDDVNAERRGQEFAGARVLGGRECLNGLRTDGVRAIVIAVGNCAARLQLGDAVRQHGFELARAVHPRAVVAADVTIGAGTVVCAGAVVNPGSSIAESVIVNTSATVDHECVIADGAHVGPGVHLGGRVRVGRGAWVGIGATVSDRVVIGAESVVGAGAVVLNDVPRRVVAFGVPARVVRDVGEGD